MINWQRQKNIKAQNTNKLLPESILGYRHVTSVLEAKIKQSIRMSVKYSRVKLQ